MKRLDLGCGRTSKEGFVGVDRLNFPGVGVVHDLNVFPYPFADNEIDEVWMDNTLEHLQEPVRVMEEIYRIARNGARVTVSVPYFRSMYACIDTTHRYFFGAQWFSYFDPNHDFFKKYSYSRARFTVDRVQFDRERTTAGAAGVLRRCLILLAEKKPWFYEQKLSHILPLDSLTFYLTVVKE